MDKKEELKNLKRYFFKDKIRLGKVNDGGYVIAKNLKYDLFLSAGIEDDISFEIDFLKLNPELKCFAYDKQSSIDQSPLKNLEIIKKNISPNKSADTENLKDVSEKHKDIFLKMDIEGHEFEWINSFNLFKNIKQMVIEFHRIIEPPRLRNEYHNSKWGRNSAEKERWKALEKINKTHYLIHLHPNNNCSEANGYYEVPDLLELTFLRKTEFNYLPELDLSPIPSPLDIKNVKDKPEFNLSGYPYTKQK
tara:strand:+ start:399 stop:1145 length:747 start_codon:yes stop_codon:yes gene_type:complete